MKVFALLFAFLLTAFLQPAVAAGNEDPGINRPNSKAYGKTLAEWLKVYWEWWITTDGDMSQSKVGNVQLMPMPTNSDMTSGQGTPDDPLVFSGSVDITLPVGTPFVLAVVGRIYSPGSEAGPLDVYGDYITAEVTLDGEPIVEPLVEYLVGPTYFDEILIASDNSEYEFFDGVGFITTPLTPGVHVIRLFDHFGDPDNVIFDNTWTITVVPKSKPK